jgi:hypothetical protein
MMVDISRYIIYLEKKRSKISLGEVLFEQGDREVR